MYKPLYRVGLTLAVMAVLLVAVGVWRMLESHGVFTAVEPGFSGSCRMVASPAGPEDIVLERSKKLAFISAMDRKAFAAGKPSPEDGIYVYAYGDPAAKPVKLAGAPKEFHPHGLSLTKTADGDPMLVAINHLTDGSSVIEVFAIQYEAGKVSLTETGRISGGMMVSPNAVAALDESHFYVVNDHTSTGKLGRWLDDNVVLPRANILYFDGATFKEVAKNLNFPSGAVISADGKQLYVSESYPRTLLTFDIVPFVGTLTEAKAVPFPAALDNSRLDETGTLWVAGRPKPWAMGPFRTDPNAKVPSQVFRYRPGAEAPELVLSSLGEGVNGASVATVDGKTLLIGSAFGRKIWNCTMK